MSSNDMRRWACRYSFLGVLLAGCSGLLLAQEPPALIALLLDTSGSLKASELDQTRRAALAVIQGLPPGSQVAVFTFDDQSRLVLPRTSDAAAVGRALAGLGISGRHTALYDALYDASRYLRESGVARSAIVLLTDGRDEDSALNLDDGLQLAQQARIPVFAVGIGHIEQRVLRRIAKLTGGEYVASADFNGPALATRIMAAGHAGAPVAAPFAAPRSSGNVVASSPVPGRAERAADGASGAARIGRLLTIPAVLVVAALAFFALRRRSRPRCPTCRRELPNPLAACAFCAERASAELSPTVVARMASTEEYLEKTVVLRERPVLAVTRGPLAGQVFELSPHSATSLGRAKANDVVLDDLSVSSQHCRIRPEDEGFMLLDLNSTNGTFVNERRVTTHRLAEGDVIKLGEMQLQFRMEQRRD